MISMLFTAREAEGTIFTGVCHSVHRGHLCVGGEGACMAGDTCIAGSMHGWWGDMCMMGVCMFDCGHV